MCDLISVYNPKRYVASDRATLVSRDYAQSMQVLLNMDICVKVLSDLLYGTGYQRTFGQLRHLLLLNSH